MKWHKEMLKKTARLQYLELGNLPMYGRTEDSDFSLSSLRILLFGDLYEEREERVLEQLIHPAPHLKEIQNVHCDSSIPYK